MILIPTAPQDPESKINSPSTESSFSFFPLLPLPNPPPVPVGVEPSPPIGVPPVLPEISPATSAGEPFAPDPLPPVPFAPRLTPRRRATGVAFDVCDGSCSEREESGEPAERLRRELEIERYVAGKEKKREGKRSACT